MKRRTLLLILIPINIGMFFLAWSLTPRGGNTGSGWFQPLVDAFSPSVSYWYVPWVVLVVTILASIWVWNFAFPNDGSGER